MNKIIRYLTSKYLLKRSISGWGLFDYFHDTFSYMFTQANSLVWGNFTLFKNYFYQNLFNTLINF